LNSQFRESATPSAADFAQAKKSLPFSDLLQRVDRALPNTFVPVIGTAVTETKLYAGEATTMTELVLCAGKTFGVIIETTRLRIRRNVLGVS
jgi:hypothetical protein